MKTTGIVRGIDSLGRIVLPKELRTNMHIDQYEGYCICPACRAKIAAL